MARKPALGRGINALIPDSAEEASDDQGRRIVQINVEEIKPNPFQPRTSFDEAQLNELMRSIQEKGVIQPITVNRSGNTYQLIAGERRWRACKMAGVETIPAVVYSIESQQELIELSLIENIQRENLNAIEEAEGYRTLMDTCFLTQDAVAQKVGRERSTVANMLRLLRLPEEIQEYLRNEQLQMGHARALLAVKDDDQRLTLARQAAEEGLTVRQVEQAASGQRESRKKKPRAAADKPKRREQDPQLVEFEEKLQHHLGTAVSIRCGQANKGRIEVEFYDTDDLERLLELLLPGSA